MALKDDYGHWVRAKDCSDVLMAPEGKKTCPGLSKNCERLSLTIRSALDVITLFGVDTGNSLHIE